MEKIKIALFGCGRIGKIHLKNILQHESTVLTGVIDPANPELEFLARQWGFDILEEEAVFSDDSIQAVLIASSSDTHIPLIEKSLAGRKHIFCEKPLDIDLDKVKNIVARIDETPEVFCLAFNRRYDHSFYQLKKSLQNGTIGSLENLTIISRDPAPPPVEYIKVSGGLFRDMTIHDFDMARWLVGEDIVSIFAQGKNRVDPAIEQAGDIDTAVIQMESRSGVLIQILNSRRAVYGYDQRIEAFGSKGLLRVENQLEDGLKTYTDEVKEANPLNFFLERYEKAYQNELDDFVTAIKNSDSPRANHHDGLQAMILAEKALESLESGKVVKL